MIPCPRCRNPLLIDQSLAGQVVACPYCGQQINVNWPVSVPSVTVPYSPPPAKRKRTSTAAIAGITMLTVVAMLATCCGGVTLLRQSIESSDGEQSADYHHSDVDKITAAKVAIRLLLKHPHDAEFGWNPTVNGMSVSGTVKVASTSGAKLTHEFTIHLGLDSKGRLIPIGGDFVPNLRKDEANEDAFGGFR